jgi:hypothetical protein
MKNTAAIAGFRNPSFKTPYYIKVFPIVGSCLSFWLGTVFRLLLIKKPGMSPKKYENGTLRNQSHRAKSILSEA